MGDADGIRTTLDELRSSGGVIGAVVGEPLRRAVDDPGAWVVLLLGALFGVLVVTDTGLRQVLGFAGRIALLGGRQLGRGFRSLQSLGSEREISETSRRERQRPMPTISIPGRGLPVPEIEDASAATSLRQ